MMFENPSAVSYAAHGQFAAGHGFNNFVPHASPSQASQGRLPATSAHQSAGLSSASTSSTQQRIAKPNEVFVGNLSYFCTETDLFELFSQYVPVEDVRIVRNDSGRRSLMFGFIIFPSPFEAMEAVKILNNHLFMGRNLK
jgi:RNA recognition motif-containing protein